MNKYHSDILREIRKAAQPKPSNFNAASYLGCNHSFYHIRTPDMRSITKRWVKKHGDMGVGELTTLLNSMYRGKSYDEKVAASQILGYMPAQRLELDLNRLDKWLNHLDGWAEIDNLCQNNFGNEEVLSRWKEWQPLLKQLNRDKNIAKRRASLVFLVTPIRQNGDKRLAKIAFKNIDKVRHEDEILITKAVSWLLRSMIVHHRGAVEAYIRQHEEDLPAIAVRETWRKLETGKK